MIVPLARRNEQFSEEQSTEAIQEQRSFLDVAKWKIKGTNAESEEGSSY